MLKQKKNRGNLFFLVISTLLFLIVAIKSAVASAESLSMQGYTGLLHVPSADTLERGFSASQFSDQLFYQGGNRHSSNLIAAYGLLPGFEVSGRLAWLETHSNGFVVDTGPRDLSANFKWRLPYIPRKWFSLAVGMEDVGGQASFFSSKYLVASRSFGPIKIHVGSADGGDRIQAADTRMDGVFGGVELNWRIFSVMADHNSDYSNVGGRIKVPLNFIAPKASLDLTLLARSSHENDDGKKFGAIALRLPLGRRLGQQSTHRAAVYKTDVKTSESVDLSDVVAVQDEKPLLAKDVLSKSAEFSDTSVESKKTDTKELLTKVMVELEKVGFVELSLGIDDSKMIWVKFENNLFNQNEIDGVGVLAGHVCKTLNADFNGVVIVLMNQKLPVQEVLFSRRSCEEFNAKDRESMTAYVLPSVRPVQDLHFADVNWMVHGERGITLKPRITATPSISNTVGTEFGVFDYSVGVYSNLSFNLAPGLLASASHLTRLDDSDDFEKGNYFYNARLPNGLSEWEIQQTFPLGKNVWNTFHVGRRGKQYRGIFNHFNVFSSDGTHRVTYRYGDFKNNEFPLDRPEIKVVSYRYYMQKYDFSIEAFKGTFWAGDKGYRIDTKFWFGDSAVGLYYRNTEAEFVGIRWTLPLGARKDNNNLPILFTGVEAWNYELQTRINEDENRVDFSVGALPKWNWEPERLYFNNDRIGRSYYHRHGRRMYEAYQSYKDIFSKK